jgi:DnaJ domain
MTGSWDVVIVALCAVAGYIVVAAFLGKRDGLRKPTEEPPKAKESGRDEPPPEPWYQILRVSPSASLEEIQAAFRAEISKYHPDRVANLGLN